jgi:hypothetical protein
MPHNVLMAMLCVAYCGLPQQFKRACACVGDLFVGALVRRFIWSPAEKPRSVPKPAAREVVVLNLYDELRSQRLPLGGSLGAPATGLAGCVAGKAGRLDKLLEFPREGGLF